MLMHTHREEGGGGGGGGEGGRLGFNVGRVLVLINPPATAKSEGMDRSRNGATATERPVPSGSVRSRSKSSRSREPGPVALPAGAYTRPIFQLNVSTFRETRWLVSLCQ